MKIILTIFFGIAVLGILFLCEKANRESIISWAASKNYTIENVEENFTTIGSPYFFLNDGEKIYRVSIRTSAGNQETWWLRTGIFGWDYEKE